MKSMVLAPKVSEKAMALAERSQYVFEVPTSANKIEVAAAVKKAFKVDVISVNIMVIKGKTKRFRQIIGQERDRKKAIVTIKKGQSIKLFEGAK